MPPHLLDSLRARAPRSPPSALYTDPSPPKLPFPLCSVGLLYHLYNQFAFNTLARVSPVSHGVCNVVKRVAIIATSGEAPA